MIHIVVQAPFSLIEGKNFVKGMSQITKDTESFIDEILPVKIITSTRTLSLRKLRCGHLPSDEKLFNREYDGCSLFFSTAIGIYSVKVYPITLFGRSWAEYAYVHYRFVQEVNEVRITVSLDEIIRYD